MAKRRKNRNVIKRVTQAVILLFSVAGGVLFAFGLNDFIRETWSPIVSIIAGATITIIAVVAGVYTTETAFAMKGRRK